MSVQIFTDLVQGTDEWLEARRGLVTASIVGNLLTEKTLKPRADKTSRALADLLVAERITGWIEPTWVSDDMMRGIESEPLARDLYAEHHDVKVDEIGFMVRDDWGFKIGWSPDGLVGDDGAIEIKAPRAKTHLRTILEDAVPSTYMAQLQCGLLVSGREWIDFVSYVGGMPLYVKRVLPDPKWHTAIRDAVEMFETTAAQMIADYETATTGLAKSVRIPRLEEARL